MSKVRIEEIKTRASDGYLTIIARDIQIKGLNQLREDLSWLIKQAELVKSYDNDNRRLRNDRKEQAERVEKLEKQIASQALGDKE